jgi:hypothetical protein
MEQAMKPTATQAFAILAAAALGGQALAFDGPGGRHYGFGHNRTITRLSANLTDPQGQGTGEISWTSDSASGKAVIKAGITLPVGTGAYGLADSNAAAAATLTLTHGGTSYTCALHITDMYFTPPKPPATDYAEFAEYALAASQGGATTQGPAFGSCASFPAALSANDQAGVTVGSGTLSGNLASH